MKSSTAVRAPLRGTALALGDAAEWQPALVMPGSPGVEQGVAGERLAVLGRDPLGRVVAVAAGQRPADVVQQQQRQARARRSLGDQPQLAVSVK